MFIQFNLLPDVKREYVKARRAKRLVMTISFVLSTGSLVLVLIMFSIVQVGQKGHINRLTKDIQSMSNNIKQTQDLEKMLSVQNQLSLLPGLHATKPETSRIFDYLSFVSPKDVKFDSVEYFGLTTGMSLKGSADSLATIEKFIANVRSVTYATANDPATSKLPYTNIDVQLSADNKSANFSLTFTFDPLIFDNTKEIIMQLGDQAMTTDPLAGEAQQ